MRRDVYQTITDQIVSQLEKGVRPWLQPWSAGHLDGRVVLPLRHNSVPYRGVNVIALWMQAMAKGYAAPIWMTFKQAIDLGAASARARKAASPSTPTRSPAKKPTPRRARRARTISTT